MIQMKMFVIVFTLFYLFHPSLEVVIAPCNVENVLIQPHFGTSLTKKELVQIVQISPVFTQNVLVGKCVNASGATPSSNSPESYFVCKQRYSTVEVYVLNNNKELKNTNYSDGTLGALSTNSFLDNFKSGGFVRDFVVVESGCDFTFNLLPLLLRPDTSRASQNSNYNNVEVNQNNYHFLNSPYHPINPSKHIADLSKLGTVGVSLNNVKSNKQTSAYESATPSSIHKQIPPTTKPKTGAKGGNRNNNQGTPSSLYVNNTTPISESIYRSDNNDLHKSSYKVGEKLNNAYVSESYPANENQAYPTTGSLLLGQDQELQGVSDKVGVPLYILSSKVDPLLKNIEHHQVS